MEAILLGIYSFFVWLIFIKFKWLPWNSTSKTIVVIIPIVGMAATILTLNVVAPSSNDIRIVKYVVQVVPQVRGRVVSVPVEPNRPVKKGELLFRIDPTPYQIQLDAARAPSSPPMSRGWRRHRPRWPAHRRAAVSCRRSCNRRAHRSPPCNPDWNWPGSECGRTANWWPLARASASPSSKPRPT